MIAGAWFDRMLAFWSPGWTVVGVVLAVGVAAAARRSIGEMAGLPSAAAVVYVMGIGVTLAITLAPRSPTDSYFLFDVTERRCAVYPADVDIGQLVWAAHWQFNLLLLAPVGAACAWASRRSWRQRLLATAASVPVLIECIQYAVISLNRVCEGMDVLTNVAGLVGGYWTARIALAFRPSGHRPTQAEVGSQQHASLDDSVAQPPDRGRLSPAAAPPPASRRP